MGWRAASELAMREQEALFLERAARLSHAIEIRMEVYVVALRAAAAFFEISQPLSRTQWQAYVDKLSISTRYPGIQGLGWAVALSPADLPAHVAAVRAEGFADYRVWPEGQRARYSAILYLEPFDWRNQRALGYDMLSDPVRQAAMERARDSGEPATSGIVQLVQETEVAQQAGVLIYVPVYAPGGLPDTVDQRRRGLRGWVYSPFRTDDLMRGIHGLESADIHLRILDGPIEEARVLHDSAKAEMSPPPGPSPRYTRIEQIAAASRTWTVVMSSLPTFEARIDRSLPTLVLSGGLVASLLVFISVVALGSRRQTLIDGYAAAQRALKEKEVLLKEVHHRVKNSLQIVVSMLTLQGIKAEDPRVRRELDTAVARVRAVAKIHERLYGGDDVAHIDFAIYLRGLCSDLQESAPEYALRVEAEHHQLTTEQAVPLGLISVELITNAIKHADAPEHRRAIDIGFAVDAAGSLVLTVRDYGVGLNGAFSLEQPRSSLGLRTVQAFVLQLGASLRFEAANPGTRWVVILPAEAADD